MAKIRNPHGVVEDTEMARVLSSDYLVRDANGVAVRTPPEYTKYDKWGNRVLSDATHFVKDVWGQTVDGTQPYSIRNAYGEVELFTPVILP